MADVVSVKQLNPVASTTSMPDAGDLPNELRHSCSVRPGSELKFDRQSYVPPRFDADGHQRTIT